MDTFTHTAVVRQLADLFAVRDDLRTMMERSLERAAACNPDRVTNPVRSLTDLYGWIDRFLTAMPWEGIEAGAGNNGQGLFRRIDQATGYFYYLFGDLQFQPAIAEWIRLYNKAWAEFLNSPASWNHEYYNLLKSDPLFELHTGKYESPDNWHCWNDFFARRLSGRYCGTTLDEEGNIVSPAEGVVSTWMHVGADNVLQVPAHVKTSTVVDVAGLLGDSPFRNRFAGGRFCHVTLDIYNYHHFHSPVSGRLVDVQTIDGCLSAGGNIIWDSVERRYRYEQSDNLGFQMLEKRIAIVINHGSGLIALVPVGVAQVGSIVLDKDTYIGAEVRKGQDLGCFLCGGSDVIILCST